MTADSTALVREHLAGVAGAWRGIGGSPIGMQPLTDSGGVLLDPSPATNDNAAARRRRLAQPFSPRDDLSTFHRVGQLLIEKAARERRQVIAQAAVEVFREALARFPDASSLHNGLGAALVEVARTKPGEDLSAALMEAANEFKIALDNIDKETAPASRLRYEINFGTTLWMQAEHGDDRSSAESALGALRSITGLRKPSPFWPHVQDNIGNALAFLGRTREAIPFYKDAIGCWRDPKGKARSESNLAAAYSALALTNDTADRATCFRLACDGYNKAIALLSADRSSPAWALAMDHLGLTLLQEALAVDVPDGDMQDQLSKAIDAFEAARAALRDRLPLEWAGVTTHLANALVSRGTQLAIGASSEDSQRDNLAGVEDIRASIGLLKEAAPYLLTNHPDAFINNLEVTCAVLAQLSPSAEVLRDIVAYKRDIITLTDQSRDGNFHHKLSEMFDRIIGELAGRLGANPGLWIGVIEDDQIVADILSVLNSSGKAPAEWLGILGAAIDRVGFPLSDSPVEVQQPAARETTQPRSARRAPSEERARTGASSAKLLQVFGEIPTPLRTAEHTKSDLPIELIRDPEIVREANRILNAYNRRKGQELGSEALEVVRRARRIIRAHERSRKTAPGP